MNSEIVNVIARWKRAPAPHTVEEMAKLAWQENNESQELFPKFISQNEIEMYFTSAVFIGELLKNNSELIDVLNQKFIQSDDTLYSYIHRLLSAGSIDFALSSIKEHVGKNIGDTEVSHTADRIDTSLIIEAINSIPENRTVVFKNDLKSLCYFWLLWEPDINIGGYMYLREGGVLPLIIKLSDPAYEGRLSGGLGALSWVRYLLDDKTPFDELLRVRYAEALRIDPTGEFPGSDSFECYKVEQIWMGLLFLALQKTWVMRKNHFFT